MNYVFGPVPSRRLGHSLGVDLGPFKTCTYDCIYCQLGRTSTKTIRRREWVRSVIEERRDILAVQTLRNWSTAASFLATTAILIATGVLHFLVSVPQQPEMLNQLNFLGSSSPTLNVANSASKGLQGPTRRSSSSWKALP